MTSTSPPSSTGSTPSSQGISRPAVADSLDPRDLRAMLQEARAVESPTTSPALNWPEWLDWAGGPCPLPANVPVEWDFPGPRGQTVEEAGYWDWPQRAGKRFCYREDAPGGWVERGDFIPPDELWDEWCPARLEWTKFGPGGLSESIRPTSWGGITHIRLRPREAMDGEMPEGWRTAK